MAQLIDKSDFIGIVKMSVNIPDSDVNFHCMDAQRFDLFPIIPDALATALQGSMGAELQAFFDDYVKGFLVCKAHARLLLWQGNNVTQFGLVRNNEDTSEPISDKQRAELIQSSEHKANIYLAQMSKAMSDADYTFDSVVYTYETCEDKPKVKPKFFSV
jgi:hypothetical protein